MVLMARRLGRRGGKLLVGGRVLGVGIGGVGREGSYKKRLPLFTPKCGFCYVVLHASQPAFLLWEVKLSPKSVRT